MKTEFIKKNKAPLIVLGLITLVIGGAIWYKNNQKKKPAGSKPTNVLKAETNFK